MKVCVCLLCLRATDIDCEIEVKKNEGTSLLTRFLKFAENYLNVSTVQAKQLSGTGGNEGERPAFCEKCKLAVISPICQLYTDLLTTQLRLSWELGRMGKLMEESQRSTSDDLRSMNLKVLTSQLGIPNMEEFRCLLSQKCKLSSVHYDYLDTSYQLSSNFYYYVD